MTFLRKNFLDFNNFTDKIVAAQKNLSDVQLIDASQIDFTDYDRVQLLQNVLKRCKKMRVLAVVTSDTIAVDQLPKLVRCMPHKARLFVGEEFYKSALTANSCVIASLLPAVCETIRFESKEQKKAMIKEIDEIHEFCIQTYMLPDTAEERKQYCIKVAQAVDQADQLVKSLGIDYNEPPYRYVPPTTEALPFEDDPDVQRLLSKFKDNLLS